MTNDEWKETRENWLLLVSPMNPLFSLACASIAVHSQSFPPMTDGMPRAGRITMNRPYDIKQCTFLFATEIVGFCKPVMPPGAVVRELARQLLRPGTSIGANLEEADAGQSRADFRSKVAISRKEARESGYWLRLLV